MNANDLTSFLGDALKEMPNGTAIGNWTFEGKTNIAYGTKAGAWNAKEFPGYLFFSSGDHPQRFIIRPASIKGKETIAIESVHNTGQLINYRLTPGKSLRTSEGRTTLYESYHMTVGKGRVKHKVAKHFLFQNGLAVDGKILSFDDATLSIEELVAGLLDWAVIRENAKTAIRRGGKVPGVVSIQGKETEVYEISAQPLNQILYGPPGTGKTFHTITKALAIIEGKDEDLLQKESRVALKKRFDDYREKGQIVFTTFHQSMSYEDFVEGIKPKMNSDEDEDVADSTEKELTYVVEPGIFRKLCAVAQNQAIPVTDFDTLWTAYILQLKSITTEKVFRSVQSEVRLEKELTNENTIWIRYKKSFDPSLEEGSKPFMVTKNMIRKLFQAPVDGSETNLNGRKETSAIISGGRSTHSYAVYKDFYQYALSQNAFKTQAEKPNNYVLIIDEINRGNISSIFGELITLIEDGKRQGQDEELSVQLPYSKERHFTVPSNLYILGTMNMADRSVEALDTALRRRFAFEEMLPQPELLTPSAMFCRLLWKYRDIDWEEEPYVSKEKSMLDLFSADDQLWTERYKTWERMKKENQPYKTDYFHGFRFHGVNLKNLLETINERIEVLMDRDHMIGHAYLMDVEGYETLKYAFQHKIIPLLQEYFYGDYRKIEMVLGSGFFDGARKKEVVFAAHQGLVDQNRDRYVLRDVMGFEDDDLLDALREMKIQKSESNSEPADTEAAKAAELNSSYQNN